MKRKMVLLLCAAMTMSGLTACGESDTQVQTAVEAAEESSQVSVDYCEQTLVGKVVATEEDTLTLQLGELTGGESSSDSERMDDADVTDDSDNENSQPPEMPESESGQSSNENNQPPEKPEGENGQPGNENSQPPEKPEGENGQPGNENSQLPEKPEGENGQPDNANSQPPEMPGGQGMPSGTFTEGTETVTFTVAEEVQYLLAELTEDTIVQIETDDSGIIISIEQLNLGMGGAPSSQPGGFGGSSEVTQGTAANTIEEDGTYTGETYTSTGDDENALRVDAAAVTLENITVDKSAGATSNTENGDFYGQNAALLATNGANVTIQGATVTSSAQNGNGVFSYGEGTVVTISDSTITTTADNSGGIQTTGGGTTNAYDLTVETSGNSSAAIRSDRGGGTVNVDGGTYVSNGYNSPAVYSTADITVKNATLTANCSEALVVEGQNSITLENCDVSGNMSGIEGISSDENVHNVMIYQSMSGDAEVGTSSLTMTGGILTSANGDLFYVTNTHCILKLSDVEIDNQESDGYLLRVSGNSASRGWGSAGANGAQVEFTAENQELDGDIVVDSISTLDMTLTGNSHFTGTIRIIENEQNGTAVEDNAVVTVEAGSTWTLTGDCTLTSLVNNGIIDFNGYTITLADGTVLSD